MGPEGKLSKKILAEFTVGLKAFWTKMKKIKQNKTTTALVKPYTMGDHCKQNLKQDLIS